MIDPSEARPAPLVEVHESPEALATAVAGALVARLVDAQADGGRAHLALTGGTIAKAIHGEVARLCSDSPDGSEVGSEVDWGRVVVWWSDERFVEPSSPDRNERQARESLLDLVEIDPAQVHPMPSTQTAATAEEGAAAYAEEWRAHGPGEFDLVMLGMGPDGHIASLFPGHPASGASEADAVAVHDSPKPPPDRITLTARCLNRTRATWFVASGAEKAPAVAAALAEDADRAAIPAASVTGHEETVWFLDRAAASRL